MTLLRSPQGRQEPRTVEELVRRFNLTIKPQLSPQATATVFQGLSVVSQDLTPGQIFVAVQGLKAHGARFALDALARGASAILTDQAGYDILDQPEFGLTQDTLILVSPAGADLRELMAQCAAWCFHDPTKRVRVAGVTGTNGKTTTTFFLDSILRSVGQTTGLIGTIEMRLGSDHKPAVRTTVEAPVLQEFFAEAVSQGIDTVTMEVSSHALSLHRVTGTQFSVVGFTNLQRDHLDFHNTMDEYFAAKAALFTPEFAQAAVINIDDEYGWQLVNNTEIETVSIATIADGPHFQEATWRVANSMVTSDGRGIDFDLLGPHGAIIASYSPLLGSVNVANAGLATLMALQMGIPAERIKHGLVSLGVVPGRMEVVSQPRQPKVIVDYAHTTEALEFALTSLGEQHKQGPGKLIVVFGAAGERDPGKRPDMGRVAIELAHEVLVTDDDPYGEDRASIRAQILAGARASAAYQTLSEQDQAVRLKEYGVREDAIAAAISGANANDTVLIAGRGHETIQDLDGEQHVLDDRELARQVLAQWRPAGVLG